MNHSKIFRILAAGAMILLFPAALSAQRSRNPLNETDPAYFVTPEARRIADQILVWQRETGGWPKNVDMVSPMSDERIEEVLADKDRRDDSTIDNGATCSQMLFLARAYSATGDVRYRDAFRRGVDYLLDGQYPNGGWPQFWPDQKGYQFHITYNDNAMVNTLELLADIRDAEAPFGGDLTGDALRARAADAFDRGIDCILATQLDCGGKPGIWCQQYDHVSLEPASARAYELPSYSPQESAAIVRLLMSLPDPSDEVRDAVRSAMQWFDSYKLTGLRVERGPDRYGRRDTRLVEDADAAPIWARYYDLERTEPYVCDRDGIPRRRLEDIGYERRNGYSWFNSSPAGLYPLYEEWAAKYDSARMLEISLDTPGANETGLVEMYRRPELDRASFDVVVSPGESIQAAVEQAPLNGTEPFKILILNGTYMQKVVIDRPNIVLVGENRDSTVIKFAEGAGNRGSFRYRGRDAGNGVISIWDEGDDCIICGLTVCNDYGSTVENTTSHQFAIFGRGTRTIVINCNVLADGNDALALWAPGGDGMYYHADLFVRCPGVDFLCPRGWCYATRCRFFGDTPEGADSSTRHAMIWHDGRGDPSKKLVITNSEFDAARPTLLGRYHHDSQFFLVDCAMSSNILDENICYAYTDKVLDPCPWGRRVWYLDCVREGGDSGWLDDNIDEEGEDLTYYTVLPGWTFGGKWDPEARIRELQDVLAY